jgi:hypothetical protein
MDRRKFILNSLKLFSVSTLFISSAQSIPFVVDDDKLNVEFRNYLINHLSDTDLTELQNYYFDVVKNTSELADLVAENFYSDNTIRINGALFSRAEVSQLIFSK